MRRRLESIPPLALSSASSFTLYLRAMLEGVSPAFTVWVRLADTGAAGTDSLDTAGFDAGAAWLRGAAVVPAVRAAPGAAAVAKGASVVARTGESMGRIASRLSDGVTGSSRTV